MDQASTKTFSTRSSPSQPITIIGAGVIGLSTALTLQSRFPLATITIVAAEIPSLPSTWATSNNASSKSTYNASSNNITVSSSAYSSDAPSADYASMWAGAHYRPIRPSATSQQLKDELQLALRTSEIMLKMAKEHDQSETGLSVMPAMELLEDPPVEILEMKSGDVYAGPSDEFHVLNQEELAVVNNKTIEHNEKAPLEVHNKVQWACTYMAYCVNVHMYCSFLLKSFVEKGGRVIQKKLGNVTEAFNVSTDSVDSDHDTTAAKHDRIKIVVNASGRNFDTDPKTKIIRGQTVLVRNQYKKTITRQNRDGSWVFLIPRPGDGGTVVGGTKEIGDTAVEARSETRKTLLDNAVKYFPDFVDAVDKFDVIMDNVGRRPWREGGLRLETEDLSFGSNEHRLIVHGYGAGGRGYELSWGVAEKLATLVGDILNTRLHSSGAEADF